MNREAIGRVYSYGGAPYHTAVLHGGPGACGSVACVAHELSKSVGVLEPMQLAGSISGLLRELYEQVALSAQAPVNLIGHSWGAWLAALFAAQYPALVKKLILVGSGPLEERFVPQIQQRRLQNLKIGERERFLALLSSLENGEGADDNTLSELGTLAEKSDQYAPPDNLEEKPHTALAQPEIYSAVWKEAEELRRSGKLMRTFQSLSCPIVIVHGEADPHPIAGITEPLERSGVPFRLFLLAQCGHSPFLEPGAKEEFYRILQSELL